MCIVSVPRCILVRAHKPRSKADCFFDFSVYIYIYIYIYNRRYSTQYFLFCGVYIIYIYMVGWFGFLTEYICARNISVPRITLTRHPYGYQARHRSPICIHIYNIMHAYNVRQCVRTSERVTDAEQLMEKRTFKFVL